MSETLVRQRASAAGAVFILFGFATQLFIRC